MEAETIIMYSHVSYSMMSFFRAYTLLFVSIIFLSFTPYASGVANTSALTETLGLVDTLTKTISKSLSENLGMTDTITTSKTTPTTAQSVTGSGGSSGKSVAPSFTQPTIGSGPNTSSDGLILTFNSQKFSINESGRLEQQQETTTKTPEKTTLFSTSTGEQVKLKFKVNAPLGIDDIRHVEFHTNQKGAQVTGLAKSDTAIIYDKYKKLEVLDSKAIFSNTNISLSDAGGGFVEITIDMTFAKPIGTSDIVIKLWNEARHSLQLHVADAINVTEKIKGLENTSPSQKQEPIENESVPPLEKPQDKKEEPVSRDSMLDTSTIEKWAGFSSESVSDKQLLDMLGIESKTETMPNWLKNLGRFVHEKGITPHEMENALRYMAKQGIFSR